MRTSTWPALRTAGPNPIIGLLLCGALAACIPASAQERDRLVELINDYRAAPQHCEGRRSRSLPPLARHPVLSSVSVGSGQFLEQALERAGYEVARAEAITITGAGDARGVMAEIGQRYCATLLSSTFSAIGANRAGDSWLIVLAQPAPPPRLLQLPGQHETGLAILQGTNAARTAGATCGERRFAPVAPLSWNSKLGEAALGHSRDMAALRYLSHKSRDGRAVSDRAMAAGYRWRSIGENIAVGQESADEVVAGWLASPGHCANIMNPAFTEMGAAYAIHGAGRAARAYWAQVSGKPR